MDLFLIAINKKNSAKAQCSRNYLICHNIQSDKQNNDLENLETRVNILKNNIYATLKIG